MRQFHPQKWAQNTNPQYIMLFETLNFLTRFIKDGIELNIGTSEAFLITITIIIIIIVILVTINLAVAINIYCYIVKGSGRNASSVERNNKDIEEIEALKKSHQPLEVRT